METQKTMVELDADLYKHLDALRGLFQKESPETFQSVEDVIEFLLFYYAMHEIFGFVAKLLKDKEELSELVKNKSLDN